MADRRKFIKSSSGYVRKSLHQLTSDGNIYEQDFMTISDKPTFAPGQVPIYSDSNFLFTIRKSINGQYNVLNGSWVKSEGEDEFWTKQNIGNISTKTTDPSFIKPFFTDLTDYAYYGSAVELIRATINSVIKRFPGGIYITNKQFNDYKDVDGNSIDLGNQFLVENPFNIDFFSKDIGMVENPYRFFCLKKGDYEICEIDSNNSSPVDIWVPTSIYAKCTNINGTPLRSVRINDIIINTYYVDGREINCADIGSRPKPEKGILIRPKKEVLELFFNELNDFGKVLLNRNTYPLYKSRFDTYFESHGRLKMAKKEYIWPIYDDGYNIDIMTNRFNDYVNGLVEMATFYDELWSDNLYRNITHESIKNLDWTFARFSDDENIDNDDLDFSRMQMILRIYGRQLDEIKRYIDGIGFINRISYNKENNPTDYCLSDLLELSGWDVKNLFTKDENKKSGPLYSGESNEYTMSDANAEFLRRLKLNSSYIFSQKGTERGLITLLSLFGLEYGTDKDYVFVEKTYKVGNLLSKEDVVPYNINKTSYDITYQSEYGVLSGIPVKEINEQIVPWFDFDKKYDGDMYFEMAGGWDGRYSLPVNDINGNSVPLTKNDTNLLHIESQKYVKYVNNIDELLNLPYDFVKDGDFVYVSKINDDERIDLEKASHYFYINDVKYSDTIDYTWDWKKRKNSEEINALKGWYPLKIEEIKNGDKVSKLGEQLLLYLSYQNSVVGNNPHFGNKKYDDGKSWVEKFNRIFKSSVEDLAAFVGVEGLDKTEEGISNIGFGITVETFRKEKIGDTSKTWVVTDELDAAQRLNSKQFEIIFNTGSFNRKFIEDYILFYLKQIIPSTTILSVNFNKGIVHGITDGSNV